ncbi:hypothetical protein [Amycolatopsis aidingensis]|uniref:hypothetical protein n=1 Tax=Amycolatopsis aidingensis TaxID=2842453 RepID=UPI001C0C2B19|nr:hypothetical protein [Amycolatopsis aidingensis]
MSSLCAGCGQPLPERAVSGRGRRPRYHGPACRQRARRARISSERGDALTAVAEVEAATAALRAALLAGADPAAEVERLRTATDNVTRTVTSPMVAPVATRRDAVPPADVTESVTESSVDTKPSKRARHAPVRRGAVDLDSVRLARSTDPVRPGWRVLTGPVEDVTLLGWLEPVRTATGRRSGGWQATTAPHLLTVPGGPWKTRQDALVRLVDHRLRTV